jgi:O-methyltransferase
MNKYVNLLRSFLAGEIVMDEKMLGLTRDRRVKVPPVTNYIRISTLDLVAEEIYANSVKGNVAEVGVYKGQFAKYLNRVFPDRKLYLFDTFTGFDEKDVSVEVNNEYSSGKQDFSDTSVEAVLGKMDNRENCIIKKGWFPESLGGLEDNFCFVSLDADLYKPIYDGLVYFYPRLSKGGYIFIHDYNNKNYEGSKQAVRQYCRENNIGYVPMSDTWGSAIIVK